MGILTERDIALELQTIFQRLQATRTSLLDTIADLSRAQLNAKREQPSGWSICEVCQHLAKTEQLYVLVIKKALKSDENANTPQRSLDFLLDRSRKLEAPEIARPTDEILDRDELVDRLNRSRRQLDELLGQLADPSILSKKHAVHPVFQEMLLIDWIKSLYLHEQRHIDQIKEMMEQGHPFA